MLEDNVEAERRRGRSWKAGGAAAFTVCAGRVHLSMTETNNFGRQQNLVFHISTPRAPSIRSHRKRRPRQSRTVSRESRKSEYFEANVTLGRLDSRLPILSEITFVQRADLTRH